MIVSMAKVLNHRTIFPGRGINPDRMSGRCRRQIQTVIVDTLCRDSRNYFDRPARSKTRRDADRSSELTWIGCAVLWLERGRGARGIGRV